LGSAFGKIYREAASRLCVSPFMEEGYRREYGVSGTILYPSQSKDCLRFNEAPRTYTKESGHLVGAYAGSISSGEYARLITLLAKALENRGGSLLLFGPNGIDEWASMGLTAHNILPQGLVNSKQLMTRLREEADFVFVPMSFRGEYNARLSFPSKLTDYTATGVPILVWGPEECSAVRWARQYAPVAEVVTSQLASALDVALDRLERAQHRAALGAAAAAVGDRLFAYCAAREIFWSALIPGSANTVISDHDARITCRHCSGDRS
jgi:hypothetical protein